MTSVRADSIACLAARTSNAEWVRPVSASTWSWQRQTRTRCVAFPVAIFRVILSEVEGYLSAAFHRRNLYHGEVQVRTVPLKLSFDFAQDDRLKRIPSKAVHAKLASTGYRAKSRISAQKGLGAGGLGEELCFDFAQHDRQKKRMFDVQTCHSALLTKVILERNPST